MLYVTTRNGQETFTAFHAINADRGSDGGLFMPFRLPHFESEQITDLKNKTLEQCVADILSLFFSTRLDVPSVARCLGISPVHFSSISHRIIVSKIWHNGGGSFADLAKALNDVILLNGNQSNKPSQWVLIAIRIALLFGAFSELERKGIVGNDRPMDITMVSGDFSAPISAWCAREMGLPINNIICSCNDNSSVWDLLHHGELHTDTVAKLTGTPEADVGVPSELERLIYGTLGVDEVVRFCESCRKGIVYKPPADKFENMRYGMYAAVVGQARIESIINNVYRSTGYLLDPYAALCYGGLQDYRARSGESKDTILWSERSPALSTELISKALGITPQELKHKFS